jgi:hypothetical protein
MTFKASMIEAGRDTVVGCRKLNYATEIIGGTSDVAISKVNPIKYRYLS